MDKKRKKRTSSLPPSFASLPNEILLNCLARISRYHYSSLSLVSKSFHQGRNH
ncbi:hypothetical protein ARALYDRAFT_901793 [Arabidopsis lyrata subsp. lyrata]|uniref:F-box domain-containing protein n=1 Tax=Arabidopsis lyrata subsp. lyrata TaxID=81972 RepID=D7LJK6_ARALL|nr:hypothetical protein ARALYDRAFT_901793 [Arabidopsis lyrata subsp. lyrata]